MSSPPESPSSPSPDEWFLFAFDHRDSFRRMAGTSDPAEVTAVKRVLFDGFRAALTVGPPVAGRAILIDEEYGSEFVAEARALGALVVMPVEASGRDELALEYGAAFGEHIEAYDPDAIKVLLRWDPHGDRALNARQGRLLAELSGWMRAADRTLMVEFLTPMREPSSARVALMVEAVAQILDAGAEPDLWKVEGLDETADCATLAAAIRAGGRADARAVVLGRGTTMERAQGWLRAARPVDAFCGFAIGKTLWQEAMEAYRRGDIARDDAVERIAARYVHLVETWTNTR